jgi:hypothetical protein
VCQFIFKKLLPHILCGLALVFLAGCNSAPLTYDELMTHPDVLGKAMMHCRMDNFTGANCETIERAESDFTALVNERASDPIAFGKKILAAETLRGKLESQYRKTKSVADKKSYDDAQLKVDELMAVLKATFAETMG